MAKIHECMYVNCKNDTTNPKYCSLSCGSQQQFHDYQYPIRMRECKNPDCSVKFEISSKTRAYAKVYCTRSCAAIVNNKVRPPKSGDIKGCLVCGKKCKRPESKFCSKEHCGQWKRERNIESWLNGDWDGASSVGLAAAIRNYLISEADGRCTNPNCSTPGGFAEVNPVTLKCPLEIDHIDGDCFNNSPDNLAVLCPNCHALTPNYRALNKGSGRAYRRKAN